VLPREDISCNLIYRKIKQCFISNFSNKFFHEFSIYFHLVHRKINFYFTREAQSFATKHSSLRELFLFYGGRCRSFIWTINSEFSHESLLDEVATNITYHIISYQSMTLKYRSMGQVSSISWNGESGGL